MTVADSHASPVSAGDIESQVGEFKGRYQAIEGEIGKVIVGHKGGGGSA